VVFAAAIATNVLRRNSIDCGCGGWEGQSSIGWPVVARNVILAAVAVTVATDSPGSIPSLLVRHQVAASELLALALCAQLVLVVYAVARSAVELLRVAQAVAGALPSGKAS
jgi:hypothetical protein